MDNARLRNRNEHCSLELVTTSRVTYKLTFTLVGVAPIIWELGTRKVY